MTKRMRKRVIENKRKISAQRDKKIRVLSILLAISLVIILLLALALPLSEKSTQLIKKYSIPLEGFERVDVRIEPPNGVILTSGCFRITALTTGEQAESIQNALQNRDSFRPNAHDLTKFIFDEYDIEVIAVKIEELRDNTYFSKLVLQQGNKILNLDARPSDAIAIALRMDKPIYIKKSLIESTGTKIC